MKNFENDCPRGSTSNKQSFEPEITEQLFRLSLKRFGH